MKKILIVVGHTANTERGAYSVELNKTEWDYNNELAHELRKLGNFKTYIHATDNYSKRVATLASEANKEEWDLVLELHFNSASNSDAQGSEMIIYRGSKKGKEYGQKILDHITTHYKTRSRGVKEITSSGRGGGMLRAFKAPAIIYEPFFGSNSNDCNKFRDVKEHACTLFNALQKL